MRVEFDGGTLLLREASEDVPYAEWDDRVGEYRAPAYRYRNVLEWADALNDDDSSTAGQELAQQETIQSAAVAVEDTARAYPALALDSALQIEPREYQQAALDAWRTNDRRGSVVLPTGSGKTFLGIQAIADAGVATLVVAPTIDLMNQWHATLTNAFGDQLPHKGGDGPEQAVGVLGSGTHEIRPVTVTTYDSAYRYIDEYGDQFGLLIADEIHHLPAPTYRQIPEMTIALYRPGLTATYERADDAHELLENTGLIGPVVYEEEVDELAGEYLSEYETIHMQVELTDDERSQYDEEYGLYHEYVDTHDFDLWKAEGY